MYITAQGPCLRNDLYCVEWDVKLYYTNTIPFSRSVCAPVMSHKISDDTEATPHWDGGANDP